MGSPSRARRLVRESWGRYRFDKNQTMCRSGVRPADGLHPVRDHRRGCAAELIKINAGLPGMKLLTLRLLQNAPSPPARAAGWASGEDSLPEAVSTISQCRFKME